ncbi:MAG: SusD/RagB family nutrient-binding outer membrane lipoprotein [Bacteroidia bacterium]|nr:SusD/RagB family nutrient-binding outer membrane lipoprotein [Bacteroidia bacterium]
MKSIKKLFILALTGGILFFTSACTQFVEGLSVDPNNPADVPSSLLLPNAMVEMGSMHGEDLAWYSQVFLQTHVGTARQMNAATRYTVLAGDINNAWNAAYANMLMDLKVIIDKSAENGNAHYSGVAKIMTALALGTITTAWGNAPYSDALKGAENTTPVYDDSETQIYPAIQTLLDQGIAELSGSSVLSPGNDDLIYKGSAAKWIAAAYALKARYANHFSVKNATGSANQALSFIEAGAIASNANDMAIPYGTADPREANPWYQFNTQRGDLILGEFFVNKLVDTDDPRLPFYAKTDAAGGYSGSPVFPPTIDASPLGAFYGSISSKLPLVTFAEVKFIEAEANFRLGNSAEALAAYTEAITASVTKVTGAAPDSAFLAEVVPANAADLTLEMIMDQKYVAMFTQFESWTDYRRTGFPALTPYPGQTSIPGRYPYAQRERDLNTANVPDAATSGLMDKLWFAK